MKRNLMILLFTVLLLLFGCSDESGTYGMMRGIVSEDERVSKIDEISKNEETTNIENDIPSNNENSNESTNKPQENLSNKEITVSYSVNKMNNGNTYTGRKSLSEITYTVHDPNNTRGLSTKKISFSFGAAKNGTPHSITIENQKIFDSYDSNALAWDNKSSGKVLYLTFDCGYEYENLTSVMLDTLKEKGVKGAFFVTDSYLKTAPDVVVRMIDEGHIVGNHTVTHPSDSAILSREELAKELLGVHNTLLVNFGYDSQYFRFPTGAYSQNAIDLVNSVGYRSVFWSIAHSDWDPENQPGVEVSFETVTSRLHPGAVILLHTTSLDNAEILGDVIDYAFAQGYTFKTLDQYPNWK